MTPNFAFSLSQDNLRLFIKVKGGWALLGTVASSAPDVAEQLAQLREEARLRAPEGMASKLLVPNDYIRYLELPPRSSEQTVRKELDGATPYAIEELAYDIEQGESATNVAAVAREFLQEAENFALDHGLAPVSFVATPREGSFTREIFFGPAAGASRLIDQPASLGPDHEPMTIVDLPPRIATRNDDPQGRVKTPNADAETPPPPDAVRTQEPPGAKTKETGPGINTPAGNPASVQKPKSADPARPDAEVAGAAGPASAAKTPVKTATQARPVPKPKDPPKPADRRRPPEQVQSAAPLASAPAFGAGKPKPKSRPIDKAVADDLPFTPLPVLPQPGILTRIGGTGFTQLVIGVIAAIMVLGIGYAILSHGGPDEVEVAQASNSAPVTEVVIMADPLPATTSAPPEPAPTVPAPRETAPVNDVILDRVITPAPAPAFGEAHIPDLEEARRIYASTGVWQKSPPPVAALRAPTASQNAPAQSVALPRLSPADPSITSSDLLTDRSLPPPPAPPPPGSDLQLDSDGYVIPSADGTLAPGGILVFAGAPEPQPPRRASDTPPAATQPETSASGVPLIPRPARLPPRRPAVTGQVNSDTSTEPVDQPTGGELFVDGVQIQSGAPPRVPPTRLVDQNDATADPAAANTELIQGRIIPFNAIAPPARDNTAQIPPGGVSLAALPGIAHPRVRPSGTIATEAAVRQAIAAPLIPQISPQAVANASSPKRRPRDIAARAVKAAEQSSRAASARNAPAVASPVAPNGPSGQTVSARATDNNTINLGRLNLIGVYGSNNNRRALVRLQNGGFVKVSVGERINGVGRVTAIGNSSIQLNQNGRKSVFEIPS